jgi:hypothetical protein
MSIKKTVVHFGVVIMLISTIIFTNPNLLLAQNVNSIKTTVKQTDFMGDVLNVYTMHGKFYLNSLGKDGIENKYYSKHEKTINDSEKRGHQILIKYHYDRGGDREIIDVILLK